MKKEIQGLSLIWVIITLFIAFITKESIPNEIGTEHNHWYLIKEKNVFLITLSVGLGSLAFYLTTKIPSFRILRFKTLVLVLSLWIGIILGYSNGNEKRYNDGSSIYYRTEVSFNFIAFQYSILTGLGLIALIYAYNIYKTGKDENLTKTNLEESKRIDGGKKLDFNNNIELRNDGYYLCRYNGTSKFGTKILLSSVLVFNEIGYVFYEDMQGHPQLENEEMKDFITDFKNKNEISTKNAKYAVNNNIISMKFFDPNDDMNKAEILEYTELSGLKVNNGLELDFFVSRYSRVLGDIEKVTVIQGLKFEFKKITVV